MPNAWYQRPGRVDVHGVPEGYDALVLQRVAAALGAEQRPVLHVARDDARLARLAEAVGFFAPEIDLFGFRLGIACRTTGYRPTASWSAGASTP